MFWIPSNRKAIQLDVSAYSSLPNNFEKSVLVHSIYNSVGSFKMHVVWKLQFPENRSNNISLMMCPIAKTFSKVPHFSWLKLPTLSKGAYLVGSVFIPSTVE